MKYFLILILLLILSFLFLLFREKRPVSDRIPELNYFDSGKEYIHSGSSSYITRGVVIFDIRKLTDKIVSDSSLVPFINNISGVSNYFPATVNLSNSRKENFKSFIKCSPPHRINDRKEPFLRYKNIISDSLRNSSWPSRNRFTAG